mmetsp:Transcript_25657/g.55176  ORF Transcript_25657/g.55176 Transcript_25657/m.55176 type:complete len:209 (+) Transcript_25657:483-1109(+)
MPTLTICPKNCPAWIDSSNPTYDGTRISLAVERHPVNRDRRRNIILNYCWEDKVIRGVLRNSRRRRSFCRRVRCRLPWVGRACWSRMRMRLHCASSRSCCRVMRRRRAAMVSCRNTRVLKRWNNYCGKRRGPIAKRDERLLGRLMSGEVVKRHQQMERRRRSMMIAHCLPSYTIDHEPFAHSTFGPRVFNPYPTHDGPLVHPPHSIIG